jgi:hypothetical protein
MPRIVGITIPAGLEIVYNRTLKMYDLAVHCNIGKNPRFLTRARKVSIRELSALYNVAYAWASLSGDARDEWGFAANVLGWHGYNLYVQDKVYRILNGIGGSADPSYYHQFKVGHIGIAAPASSAEIRYSNQHRFYPPGALYICSKTALTASGPSPSVQVILQVHRYYSGQNLQDDYAIDLPLSEGWDKRFVDVPQKKGFEGRWEVRIVLTDVTGDLWFDNLWVQFNGADQNPDPFCDNIVKWYEMIDKGEGVVVESIYPTGGAL